MSVLRKYNPTTEQWEILQGGVQGLQGPPVSLTKGTVTTGAPGTNANFTVTGTPPDQKLNLTVPRGDVGPVGPTFGSDGSIIAAGRPDLPATMDTATQDEVLSAPPGTLFRSTDGAGVGAWMWMKQGTQWSVTDGDTGWRNVAADLLNGWTATMNGRSWAIRRLGSIVSVAGNLKVPTANVLQDVYTVPVGFRLSGVEPYTGGASAVLSADGSLQGALYLDRPDMLRARSTGTGPHRRLGMNWLTLEPWPTILPGIPS